MVQSLDATNVNPSPHVLMFPLAAQGHVTPMLKLAELLCLANIKVTFVNTACTHKRMTQNGDIEAYFSRYPGFEFRVIPSGISDDVPRTGPTWIRQMITGLAQHAVPFLRETLKNGQVTCLIADSMLSYAFDVAYELEVPVMEFKVYGASFLWVAVCLPDLIKAGEIPFKDDDMDKLVQKIPGMSDYLRRRDLPSFFQVKENSKVDLERMLKTIPTRKTHPIILNTFEDLEGPILSLLREHNPRTHAIGPLDANLKYRLTQTNKESKHSGSLLEEDRTCISWLNTKPDKSVVYVAFGTTVVVTKEQVLEIWSGLQQSDKYFLWAIRPDIIIGSESDTRDVYEQVLKGTSEERGLVVRWAPQEEVLAHPAVGGFFSHSGWNSVLESITAGVPMLGWPYIGDQQVYSRNLEHVWKIGLEMKDVCDRLTVEKLVRGLMDNSKDELQKSMAKMSELAKKSISEGGSSYCDLNRLIEEIKTIGCT